jgi:hypothetical protein
MALRKFESQFFSEELLILAEYLVEGDVECSHDSSFLFGICHEVVLGVVELKEDDLVDPLGTVVPKIIKLIIEVSIILQFVASGLGRHVFQVVLSLVVVDPGSE